MSESICTSCGCPCHYGFEVDEAHPSGFETDITCEKCTCPECRLREVISEQESE